MKGLEEAEVLVSMRRWLFGVRVCVVVGVGIGGVWVWVERVMKDLLELEYAVMLGLATWLLFVSMAYAVGLVLEMGDQM